MRIVAVPAMASVVGLIKETEAPDGNGDAKLRDTVTVAPWALVTVPSQGAEIARASSQVRRTILLVKTFAPKAKLVWIPSALVLMSRVVPGFGTTCTWSAVAPLV